MNDIFKKMEDKLEESEYRSSFNFEKFEIAAKEKDFILRKERIISRELRKNHESLFTICEAIYAISVTLKTTNSFMEWYTSCGLNKDMISMFLKRYSLYREFPKYQQLISALTDSAVKIMTHKDVTYDDRILIVDKRITNTENIKEILYPCIEKNKKIFQPKRNFFDIKKISKIKRKIEEISTSRELKEISTDLISYKNEIKELEKLIKDKEKEFENTNNLKMFDENTEGEI